MDLFRKYAPRTLADIRGQDRIIQRLRDFVARPHGRGFLFSGGTGVGKTATAWALIRDLQPDLQSPQLEAQVIELKSGCQDVESIRNLVSHLNFVPMFGRFQAIILNEAESMHEKAVEVFLDPLENLPDSAIIIFTTNKAAHFDQRFRDRCKHYRFNDTRDDLGSHIRDMADAVWMAEVGGACPLSDDELMPCGESPSFRRVLRVIEDAISDEKTAGQTDNGEPYAGERPRTEANPTAIGEPTMVMATVEVKDAVQVGNATTKQATDYLQCGRTTLFRLIKEGRLQKIKFGRSTRLSWDQLREFSRQGC